MMTPPPPRTARSNAFNEKILPDVQPEPHSVQPEVMFPRLVPSCLVEEADSHLATISFQVVVESDKTPL